MLLGISSRSRKHACPYCVGTISLKVGTLRTFGNMVEWFGKFESAGLKMKDMQLFKNVIHKSLITGCPETTVLSTVPLPELHLLMGLVNWALELV